MTWTATDYNGTTVSPAIAAGNWVFAGAELTETTKQSKLNTTIKKVVASDAKTFWAANKSQPVFLSCTQAQMSPLDAGVV